MALFTVLRPFPGASEIDLQAAAFRSITCLPYHPGLDWIRSYWDPSSETLTCVFEARDEAEIRHHAARADLPCAAVTPVEEMLPGDLVGENVLSQIRERAASQTAV